MVGAMKIALSDVAFSYGSAEALRGVTFSIADGEMVALAGPNGSGKTTLLKCINRKLSVKGGAVLLEGTDVRELARRDLGRRIGVVPQMSGATMPFRVWEVVLMGRSPHLGRFEAVGKGDIEVAERALALVRADHLADRPITELSGGEHQRVIVARALAQEPKVLLLDEPTLHLDVAHQLELLELVRHLVNQRNLTVVMASHDLNLALRYSDMLLLLESGRVHAAGRPGDVLTVENLRKVYRIEARIHKDGTEGITSIVPVRPLPSGGCRTPGAERGGAAT